MNHTAAATPVTGPGSVADSQDNNVEAKGQHRSPEPGRQRAPTQGWEPQRNVLRVLELEHGAGYVAEILAAALSRGDVPSWDRNVVEDLRNQLSPPQVGHNLSLPGTFTVDMRETSEEEFKRINDILRYVAGAVFDDESYPGYFDDEYVSAWAEFQDSVNSKRRGWTEQETGAPTVRLGGVPQGPVTMSPRPATQKGVPSSSDASPDTLRSMYESLRFRYGRGRVRWGG